MATGRAQKSKDTDPEKALRSALYDLGLRGYVTHKTITLPSYGGKTQRTTPDVLFRRQKVAVFMDGCWFHGCLVCPQPKPGPWRAKAAKARARDKRHARYLQIQGYKVVRIWEHDDPGVAAQMIAQILEIDPPPGVFGL